ncbi:MAG: hypothetical protein IKV00_06780, partial [Clostridia bacterium]|nr:hypothetical protein [Clostridia bacterium]
MKKLILFMGIILLLCSAVACHKAETETEPETNETEPESYETETETKQVIYENITAEEAKQIMDTETGYVI